MNFSNRNTFSILLLASTLFFTPLFFTSSTAYAAVVVDINRADAATMIANWKGIGEKKAKAIIAYRKKNGPFANINDLSNVKGIGEGLIKNNRKYMSVKGGIKATAKTATDKSNGKSASKKSTAKKSTSDKTATKKSSSKKPSSKNSSTKKSTSKKSTGKKSSSKKKTDCKPTDSKAKCKKKKKSK